MSRQGLTTESVVAAAADLIETTGWERLSLHKLAERLGVKTASLYTHIDGLEHLCTLLAVHALEQLRAALQDAVADQPSGKSLCALSVAYCMFARENQQLYRIIMAIPHSGDPSLAEAGRAVKAVLFDQLAQYTQDQMLQIRLSRHLHSLLHGFVGLDQLGFFDSAFPVDTTLLDIIEDFVQHVQTLASDPAQGAAHSCRN